MPTQIDAHHHLWRYTPNDFKWIGPEMSLLQHDFSPADLAQQLSTAGIDGSIVVQARQTLDETSFLLDCAAKHPQIRGVVGWLPLIDPNLPELLQQYRYLSALKGLRHVIQDEPDDRFLLRPDFNRGIASLFDTGLVYDILIQTRHLQTATLFARRHPQQAFVLDHLAKPPIRTRQLQPWRNDLLRLAECPNVVCKLSGLVTEADWQHWTLDDLLPYLDTALEAFGPNRLLAGSDWPVCLVASTYERWWSTLRQWAEPLTTPQRLQIFGGNAERIYKLDPLT